MRQVFLDSINNKQCIEIVYHGFSRVVEPHTFGNTTAGNDAIRAWQVRGGSVSNEPVGWKLFRLDEMPDVQLLNEAAQAPRQGYKRGDKGMQIIYCQM